MCHRYIITIIVMTKMFAKPTFTEPPFVNSRSHFRRRAGPERLVAAARVKNISTAVYILCLHVCCMYACLYQSLTRLVLFAFRSVVFANSEPCATSRHGFAALSSAMQASRQTGVARASRQSSIHGYHR